ncbi:hypothetical protein AB0J80_32710 [Actinoplanes sp. NPDC049548]|uniref:hypothetical protein n=1 Tax=Actinoplanes sp. NPDC049548 TaxID=3155152 RepID=UPI003423E577
MESNGASPAYGYGKFGRPLHTARDRDAEAVRTALRKARLRDFNAARHPHGFVVQDLGTGGGNSRPLRVLYCGFDPPAERILRYAEILTAAGFKVDEDPDDPYALLVHP